MCFYINWQIGKSLLWLNDWIIITGAVCVFRKLCLVLEKKKLLVYFELLSLCVLEEAQDNVKWTVTSNVCECVCVYVCMYVCIHIYIYTYIMRCSIIALPQILLTFLNIHWQWQTYSCVVTKMYIKTVRKS